MRQRQDSYAKGLFITLIIAILAALLAKLPYLDIVGQLVIAILIGIVWGHTCKVKPQYRIGIEFSSKKLLRVGIILLGLRLNMADIYHAGWRTFLFAGILLSIALTFVYALSRLCKVDKTLSLLTACGTAICGAAAIVAIAPLLKAKESITAVSVAVIAVLGTLFTLIYTFLFPFLPLSPYEYGMFAGGTLHEIAHAVAASSAGGTESEDIAIVVKLTRVALLVPVALLIGITAQRLDQKEEEKKSFAFKKLPIPWFIFGFLFMSAVNTAGIIPVNIVENFVTFSYLLLGMAMAGLGLNVELTVFKKLGFHVFYAAFLGSIVLAGTGYCLIYVMGL